MGATDPLYEDMGYEIRQRCKAQRTATPRAWALREVVKGFFRELPLGHPLDEQVALALDGLNDAIEWGVDIEDTEEEAMRQRLGLFRRSA